MSEDRLSDVSHVAPETAATAHQTEAPAPATLLGAFGTPQLQRKLQRRLAQRKADAAAASNEGVLNAAEHGTSGASGPLPHAEQIQKAFGHHDISGISAHTDGAAKVGANAMGALAFASGDRVAFAETPDLHTAAHEAAHVVQQRGGVSLKGGVGEAGDPYEQHADRVADAVVAGRSAESLLDPFAGGAQGGRTSGPGATQRLERSDGAAAGTSATDQRALKEHVGFDPNLSAAAGFSKWLGASTATSHAEPSAHAVQMVKPASKSAALALADDSAKDIHLGSGASTPVGKRHGGPHGGIELKQQLTEAGDKNIPSSFKEYDVNPKQGGRDGERIVVGDNGRIWYTGQHYKKGSFEELV